MLKKIIGYGLLIIIAFFATITLVPSDFSPEVSEDINGDQFLVQSIISDIQQFPLWDPRAISDSTASLDFSVKEGLPIVVVTDSLDRLMATYKVIKSNLEEVQISVELAKMDPHVYHFKLVPNGGKTKVTWSMSFEGNLMMLMFGAEEKLEEMFVSGLKSLNTLVSGKK